MERHEILEAMSELKLYGMQASCGPESGLTTASIESRNPKCLRDSSRAR
jgi:hypothetical protein